MPRYVIHVGPHRTASTYLQTAFRSLHPALLRRGIHYPLSLFGGAGPGHDGIATRLRSGAERQLVAELSKLSAIKADTVLLSAEDFATLPTERLIALRNMLGKQPIEIIFYARRWAEVIASHWHGSVQAGAVGTLPETWIRHLSKPFESNVINMGRVIERFANVFGVSNIRIACYNVLRDTQIDPIEHFATTFLGWSEHLAVDRSRQNASLGPIESEIIRAVNVLRTRRGDWPLPWRYLASMQSELDLTLLTQTMEREMATLQVDERLPPFQNLHTDFVKAYRSNIVAPKLAHSLFSPQMTEIKYVQGNYAYVDGVLDALRALDAKLCEPIDAFLATLATPVDAKTAAPPEFDPRRYLMRNIDVFQAKTDPYTHYQRSGKAEGRRW